MATLRQQIIKLACDRPEMRAYLVPILRQAASYEDYVKKKKDKHEQPLSKEDWERRVLQTGHGEEVKEKVEKRRSAPTPDFSSKEPADKIKKRVLPHVMKDTNQTEKEVKKLVDDMVHNYGTEEKAYKMMDISDVAYSMTEKGLRDERLPKGTPDVSRKAEGVLHDVADDITTNGLSWSKIQEKHKDRPGAEEAFDALKKTMGMR